MDDIAKELASSPELFPYQLDLPADSVSFIRLKRADYERASFLDARILALAPPLSSLSLSWLQTAAAIDAAHLTEHCGFIFHIGHVGSTLLSRLLGTHAAAFSLREPMILRTFAACTLRDADFEARLGGCLKLLSRTYDGQRTAVVKATSFVSELATSLLSRASTPKAVMMYVSPESYIATILGGPNSRQEARMLVPSRLLRLQRRIGGEVWRLESLSEGEAVALAWACEMSALAQAAKAAPDLVFRVDFDRFLACPEPILYSVLRHFDIDATLSDARAILEGPDMRRYSKAPEHAYDTALRRDVLNEARAAHGYEIKRGLAWLDRAAAAFAPVRAAKMLAE